MIRYLDITMRSFSEARHCLKNLRNISVRNIPEISAVYVVVCT